MTSILPWRASPVVGRRQGLFRTIRSRRFGSSRPGVQNLRRGSQWRALMQLIDFLNASAIAPPSPYPCSTNLNIDSRNERHLEDVARRDYRTIRGEISIGSSRVRGETSSETSSGSSRVRGETSSGSSRVRGEISSFRGENGRADQKTRCTHRGGILKAAAAAVAFGVK